MAGLVGIHPLRGPNIEEFGVRFPPLSDAYDLDLRVRTHKAWAKLGLDKQKRRLHEGVYAFVAGPTYVIQVHLLPLYFAMASNKR
jgi:purine-nucleoside phosphorylase